MRMLLAFIIVGLNAQAALAASFDCSKAMQPVEKAICTDASLSALDEYLDRYYKAALDTLPDAANCLKSDQRQWVKSRNACAADKACLSKVHLDRLATLDALQPGASALKNIELPTLPSLVTIIPPEGEGSKSKSGKPFKLDGTLLHEQADQNNMGFAVKPAKGPARAFVFDIDIGNSPAHDTVRTLIETEPKARFRVSGLAGQAAGFADGDCRFIYRLP